MSVRFRGNALSTLGLAQEDFDCEPVVHLLAPPTGDGRVLVDAYALSRVLYRQLLPVGERTCVIGSDAVEGLSARSDEAECTVIEELNDHPKRN